MLSGFRDLLPPVPQLLEILDLSLQLLGQKVILAEGREVAWRRELRSGQLEGRCLPGSRCHLCGWRQDGWLGLTGALRDPGCVSLGDFGSPRRWALPVFVASPVLQIGGGCGAGLDMEVEDG